jgi:vacuolar-type H+-ATPase subunit C/Vma6
MSQNYYYLVAGLKEYQMDSQIKGFDALAIRTEILEQISSSDRKLVDLLYKRYDVENILSALDGKSTHNPLGNMSAEEIRQIVEQPEISNSPLGQIIHNYNKIHKNAESHDTTQRIEDEQELIDTQLSLSHQLWKTYYDLCAKSHSSFIRQWAEFELNQRNIVAAINARKIGINPREILVGDGEIVSSLSKSQSADFGLKGQIDYIDQLLQILESDNLLEKEKRLDKLRWDIIEQIITYEYFTINRILGYLVRINIIDRWLRLDKSEGERLFRELSNSLRAPELVDSRSEEIIQKK